MNLFLRVLVSLVDCFIPKVNRLLVIPCLRDDEWQGNCDFLYTYIKNNNDSINVKILCASDSKLLESVDTQMDAIELYSLRGLWSLVRAKVIIYHHGPLAGRIPILPFRRFNLHINHGIHYKKVELSLDKKTSEYKRSSIVKTKWFCKFHAVSSQVDALSCCAYYHIKLSNIFVTGIPRNDIFFNYYNNITLPSNIQHDVKKIKNLCQDKKIIVYAPTWRNSGNAYNFSENETKILSTFLKENNAVLFYAGHPYLKERNVPKDDNIYDYNLLFNDIQSVLTFADCLITDYSSVWIDYLLKCKPILSFQFDKDNYKDERGFLFDPETIFPGDIVFTFSDLLIALNKALVSDINTHANYLHAYKTFHYYNDGKNCKRIFDIIKKVIDADNKI